MKRKELLEEAAKITNGEREEHYGTPENNFANIALLWSAYTGYDFYPADVAVMMILMKAARLKSDIEHLDSWVDIAGYASCGGEIVSTGD